MKIPEQVEQLFRIIDAGSKNGPGGAFDAVLAAMQCRDELLARALPYLEQQLAAQGDAPERALLDLQHEIAAHLNPQPAAAPASGTPT